MKNENWLNRLMLLNIRRGIEIFVEEVIENIAKNRVTALDWYNYISTFVNICCILYIYFFYLLINFSLYIVGIVKSFTASQVTFK